MRQRTNVVSCFEVCLLTLQTRSKRVAMAKENGQYLEFSTRGSPLFPLRGAKDISSTDVMQQMTTEGVKDSPMARESKERPHKHDATLEIAAQKETLQSLQEGMNKLLESKSFDGEAATQLEEVKVENAALLEQNKQLTHLSTKLEGTIRELETAKEELTSTLSRAKEQHLVETTRLNGEAEAVKREFEIRLVSVQESKGALENQLLATEGEKDAMAKRVLELEKELVIAHNNDRENNAKMQENGQLHEEIVKKLEAEVAKAMNELQEREDQHEQEKASLAAEIKRYKEDVDLLENQLLPEAEAQRQESDRQLTEMRKLQNELTSKVTASKEKVVQLDREKRNLKEQLDTLNQDSQEMFSEQQSQISELHTKLEHQEKLLCVEQDKTKEAQQLRESMEKELEGLAEDLESKQQHIDEWTGKFEVSERERATLLATLKLEREANASLCEQKNDAMQKGSDAAQAIQNLRDSLYKETARSEQLQLKLTTAEQERDNTIKNLNEFDQREAELYRKLREGEKVRRELHNRVMQLSGNIRVYVRVRPPLPGEVERQMAAKATKSVGRKRKHAETEVDPMPFKFPGLYDRERGGASGSSADDLSKNLIEVVEPRKDRGGLKERRKKWRYGFDHIFTPTQNQDDVWEATEPLVQSAVDGFNVCIFAYGQTGSGKSYTMLGENSNQGIVSRAVSKLFAAKEQLETLSQGATKVEIAVELLEIYNEEIRDLLAPTKGQQKLKVANNDVVGNVLATAASKDNVMAILDLAQGRRCVKATKSNDSSSRSHMVFTVHFDVKSGDGIQRKGKLHVCDLAGSERLSKSGANASVSCLCKFAVFFACCLTICHRRIC